MKKLQGKLLFDPPDFLQSENKISKKSDFEFLRKLGDGSYSQVWKVKHKRSSQTYAIKQVPKSKVLPILNQFTREVEILYKLSHPHIIKLFSHFEDDRHFFLIMEIMEGGSLFHKLYKEKYFPEPLAAQCFREIVTAVEYMHSLSPPLVHRDIKPENIMLDTNSRLKLIDFGWANYVDPSETRRTYCGTLEYMSPEMLLKKSHGLGIDIWCLGVLLYEMLVGQPPFKSPEKSNLYKLIIECAYCCPAKMTKSAKELISQMLDKDLDTRLTITQVKNSDWLTSIKPIRKTIQQDFLPPNTIKKIILKIEYNTEATNSSESDDDEPMFDKKRGSLKKLKSNIHLEKDLNLKFKKEIFDLNEKLAEEQEKFSEIEQKVSEKKEKIKRSLEMNNEMMSKIFDLNLEIEKEGHDFTELIERREIEQKRFLKLTEKCNIKKNILKSLRREVSKGSICYTGLEEKLAKLKSALKQINKVNTEDSAGKIFNENELKLRIDLLKQKIEDFNLTSNFTHSELVVAKEISNKIKSEVRKEDSFIEVIERCLDEVEEKMNGFENKINDLKKSFELKKCFILNNFKLEKTRILLGGQKKKYRASFEEICKIKNFIGDLGNCAGLRKVGASEVFNAREKVRVRSI